MQTSDRIVDNVCTAVNISGGVLVVSVLGLPIIAHAWWWRIMMIVSLGFVVLQFLPMLLLAPESPVWLCSSGKTEQARASLRQLRGSKYAVEDELQALVHHTEMVGIWLPQGCLCVVPDWVPCRTKPTLALNRPRTFSCFPVKSGARWSLGCSSWCFNSSLASTALFSI